MAALTPRQAEVLAFILDFQREHGMPPTRKEIAAYFGWSSINAAQEHVNALRRKGAITTKHLARGIFV
jgi:repressor LexA